MDLFLIFLTGLTTGGITCVAVQGGLLVSALANLEKSSTTIKSINSKSRWQDIPWGPLFAFLISKLIAYTIVGALFGLIGSVFTINLTVRVIFQSLSVLFMFSTAMNLLNVHPIFRYVVIQPPRSITRKIRSLSKHPTLFAPALLGLMTIFIPCGVTQAMEVIALSSANPVTGALVMASFVIGTMPLFTLIGIITAKLSQSLSSLFYRFAALLLIIMSLYTLNGIFQVLDLPVSYQKVYASYQRLKSFESHETLGTSSVQDGSVQKIDLTINSHGYEPNYFRVKVGTPVELTLNTDNVYSCANSFTMRAFNIFVQLKPKDRQVVTFTPEKPGQYTFACSMGMYSGIVEAI